MTASLEEPLVFNVVWTGSAFTHLRYLVASQIAHSRARFRFVVNHCPPEQTQMMRDFAAKHPDRVVEVLEVDAGRMIGHGQVLDRVLAQRDDGSHFCLIDADIMALDPFLGEFLDTLDTHAAVSSGRGIGSESDVIPEGHPGVNGEYFYTQDGFLFGSPHFALYQRAPLMDTLARWDVGFQTDNLREDAKRRLHTAGLDYLIYDTGKLVNAFLQLDGHAFDHFEHPNLLHIGGVSHYLAPTGYRTKENGETEPDWAAWPGPTMRYEVAHFSADVLRASIDRCALPPIPEDSDSAVKDRLHRVRELVPDVVDAHRSMVEG